MRIIKGKKEKKLRACIQHNKISKRHICCASSCIVKAAGKKNFIQLLLDSFSVCFLLLAKLERKKYSSRKKNRMKVPIANAST